jgi:hypothetical protein
VLLEIEGWRLLTDPTFDPCRGRYNFGWGTGSRKTAGPAIDASEVGQLDAVLLSHDQHDDNLDSAGRGLLPGAHAVITTIAGAKRLGGDARGLAPWATTRFGRMSESAARRVGTSSWTRIRRFASAPSRFRDWCQAAVKRTRRAAAALRDKRASRTAFARRPLRTRRRSLCGRGTRSRFARKQSRSHSLSSLPLAWTR